MASTAEQYTAQDNIAADLSRQVGGQQPQVPRASASSNFQVDSGTAGGEKSGSSTIAPDTHGIFQQGISPNVPGDAGGGGHMGSMDVRRDNGGGGVSSGVGHNGETVNVGGAAQGTDGVNMEKGVDCVGDNGGQVDVGGGSGRSGQATDSGLDTESEDDPNEENRTARRKLRRACDYCTTKKVRCDGTPPCRQCKKRKIECRFSICQRSGPRMAPEAAGAAAERLNPTVLSAADLAAAVASATAAGAAVGGSGPTPSHQMATALSGGGITSKTDVTYLNFFLKEFNAFVPLATQEILKDALNPTPAALTERSPNGGEEFRRQNARVAVIQGCIAIGAMLKGNNQVMVYMRNVREALTNCFDFVSAESMGAFMVTAYCHDLMGNAAATRNYMEFAKAIATQLPQVTVDHELVFQFYRVCSEVHNSSLSATPKLLQHSGASAPCYQVLNVLTYALYDLAHLATEEFTGSISKAQVIAELNSLLPIIARADVMSRDNASSFGALGMMLVKGVLGYILVRLGKSQNGLEILSPLVSILTANPGLLRQVMCWHICHCMLVIFLEHGWFKEYEAVRVVYNRLLQPDKNGGQLFTIWGRGHYKDALHYPPVERLHSVGNSFLCMNPVCKAINRDLSEGVQINPSTQVSVGMGPQPVINMVTGGGFLNFDSEEGVNVSNASNQGVPSPTLRYSFPGFVIGADQGQHARQAGSTVSQPMTSESGDNRPETRNSGSEMPGSLSFPSRAGDGRAWNCSGSSSDVGDVSSVAMVQQASQPPGARDNTTSNTTTSVTTSTS